MGTRSNVVILEDGKELVRIYRQFDGYPSGIGRDILDILNGGEVIIRNGYQPDDKPPKAFNGMGCLAAYLIGKLKGDAIGNVYIFPAGGNARDCGTEYLYTISRGKSGVDLNVTELYENKNLFSGDLGLFNPEKIDEAVEA